jgi:type IX secretion system PorP/SprF family membrane protein
MKTVFPLMISLLFVGEVVWAQQDPHFTMYRNHMTMFNPDLTGINGNSLLNLSYKSQWVSIDGAPETQVISFGTPMGEERAGIGFNVINDKTFVEDQTAFFINFSYKLSLSDKTDLYLGIQGGGNAFRVNASRLKTYSDDLLNQDPNLIDHSQFNPNVGVGIYLVSEKVFLSLSAPKILNTKRFVEKEGFYTSATDRVHSYISAGRHFSMSDDWTFTPYFLTRFVNGAPIFSSINTAWKKTDQFELGLEYNLKSSLGANMIFEFNNMGLGYAYTRSIHKKINQYSVGSHELLLRISFGSNKNGIDDLEKIDNDRGENGVEIGTTNMKNNNISKRF